MRPLTLNPNTPSAITLFSWAWIPTWSFLHIGREPKPNSFVKDNKGELVYINGSVKKFNPMDIDMINYSDMKKLFGEVNTEPFKAMYWYDPTSPDLEAGIHTIYGEKEIIEMCENKRQNQGTNEVYLFSDHPIIVDVEDADDIDGVEHNIGQGIDGDFSDAEISDDDSYDSHESAEDEPYKPPPPGYESDTDEEFVSKGKGVAKKAKTSNVQSCSKKKVGDAYKKDSCMKKKKKKGAAKPKGNSRRNAGQKMNINFGSKPNINLGAATNFHNNGLIQDFVFGSLPIFNSGSNVDSGHDGAVNEVFSDESEGLGNESAGFVTPQSSDNEGDGFDWP
ncbi:hypothetical protein PIB30_054385 [Stylosanthes scabra]|uniref:PB1-like domain-containing protein n=1 Tax=Stylosanthes scabra TaxID=79078 RepID=A0ABU6TJP7_9FABA|nr:hypothetical protein [Stylosanthes scabra]